MWAALVLLTCVGCWEEIHYTPNPEVAEASAEDAEDEAEESTTPIPGEPEAPGDETAADAQINVAAETPAPPEADDLFNPLPATQAAAPPDDLPAAVAGEPAPAEESVLPTPAATPADSDQLSTAAAEEGAEGRRGDLAATGEERRHVWEAASKWSLAAAILAKGLDASRYQPILDEAIAAAEKLDIGLPPAPTTERSGDLEATVIEGLRGESAVALASAVANRFGPSEAAMADLAVRSHLLLLTYSPRTGDAALQAEALRRAAEGSGLPAEVWEPLVKLLEERAPFDAVKRAALELDNRVAVHLTAAADPSK